MLIVIDQYGQTYRLAKYPRKELLELLGATGAQKIYRDTVSGEATHVGYLIRGLWLDVFRLVDAFDNRTEQEMVA
jgi:hypothetical protein